MGILNYFSGDEDKRARFIFDLIAPVYGVIDKAVSGHYRMVVHELNNIFPLAGKTVLDVGTGTGGWIAALAHYPLKEAVGVDFSGKMIRQARRNHPEIVFEMADGKAMAEIGDDAYDLVTCSFVMHGMKRDLRQHMLREMFRIARRAVVVHDFYDRLGWSTRLLETLERSDYKNFLQTFEEEMKEHTAGLQIVAVDKGNALYVGRKGETGGTESR